jgi:hypothetical protein
MLKYDIFTGIVDKNVYVPLCSQQVLGALAY